MPSGASCGSYPVGEPVTGPYSPAEGDVSTPLCARSLAHNVFRGIPFSFLPDGLFLPKCLGLFIFYFFSLHFVPVELQTRPL
jgi:hypothetical protein